MIHFLIWYLSSWESLSVYLSLIFLSLSFLLTIPISLCLPACLSVCLCLSICLFASQFIWVPHILIFIFSINTNINLLTSWVSFILSYSRDFLSFFLCILLRFLYPLTMIRTVHTHRRVESMICDMRLKLRQRAAREIDPTIRSVLVWDR